jgi:hypothetical protein
MVYKIHIVLTISLVIFLTKNQGIEAAERNLRIHAYPREKKQDNLRQRNFKFLQYHLPDSQSLYGPRFIARSREEGECPFL